MLSILRVAPLLLMAGLALGGDLSAAPPDEVKIVAGKEKLDFKVGDFLVTSYVIGPKVAKPYFFPVHAAPGIRVTRPWPMIETKGEAKDHKHQKSIWFCHGDVIPEGMTLTKTTRQAKGVDFWSEEEGHGRIVCTKVGKPTSSKNHAQVTTHNEWVSADGVKILDETRTLHLINLGEANLLVLDIDLHASVVPITFGDTKEGSMGVRVRESLCVKGAAGGTTGQLVNAQGHSGEGRANNLEKKGVWGLKSEWCDYSGPAPDEVAGIALFADPGNPYPTYWHSRNYGLMAANPFGRAKSGFPDARGRTDLVKLDKGQHLKLRYGVYLHKGDAKAGKVAEAYQKFVAAKEGK